MKIELYNDNFQNFKRYNIPKAQLVIADIPYNIGRVWNSAETHTDLKYPASFTAGQRMKC